MTEIRHPDQLPFFMNKMKAAGLQPVVMDAFACYYEKVVSGDRGLIYNRDIRPVDPSEILHMENLTGFADAGSRARSRTVMIVLNGGLGTSMGLTGPKSLLTVRNGQSFLEMIVRLAEKKSVRLAFMNSFNTHEATLAALTAIDPKPFPCLFVQNRFPKIFQHGLAPAVWPQNPDLEWNPPGHGDIYTALVASGVLQQLLDEGIRYALIANSDNLGATLDDALLGYFSEKRLPFMMEVSQRQPVDFKGGHLAVHSTGRLILREVAQCPEDELDISRDIAQYQYFNTNNIWVNLEFLNEMIGSHGAVILPMILNPKTIDPRDESSPPVYQIESAMGSAIFMFEGAAAVKVPRTRFFPVKKCNELLAIRSDRFDYYDETGFQLNPELSSDNNIVIQLDSRYYGKIDQFEARFPFGAPSLKYCDSLKVTGDVVFGRDVELKGDVEIVSERSQQMRIPDEALVEGVIYL
jgi:UTP--glucose-1-phosphate uridylyltransferase